jgi:hypothetical protein
MMSLSNYQKAILQDKRTEVLDETVKVWTITKTGSGNIYGQGKTETKTSVTVSAKVGWGVFIDKDERSGGFIEEGDCRILVSLANKSAFEGENKYVEVDGVNLNIIQVKPVKDTAEAVILCRRR